MDKIMPQIKHVIVVMLENRSLDNLLGWLYADENNTPCHNVPATKQPFYDGLGKQKYALQFSCSEKQVSNFNHLREDDCGDDSPRPGYHEIIHGASANNIPSVDPFEPYLAVNQQLYWPDTSCPKYKPSDCQDATMTGFLANYYRHKHVRSPQQAQEILQTYSTQQLPVLSTLAKSYAVSDRWFSSVPSQTYCNRGFMGAGTSCGQTDNDLFKPFDAQTIWNVLDEYHVSWKIYYQDALLGHHCLTRHLFKPLHDMCEEQFQNIETFYCDAENGQLPTYSFVEPAWNFTHFGYQFVNGNSYHPPAHLTPGEEFVRKVFDKVTKGAWEDTLLILTFDEHGGTYDHVPPVHPARAPWDAPGYTQPILEHGFDFRRYGVRVPMIMVSPWIQEQTVFRSGCTTQQGDELPYDHTSILATLLRWQRIPKTKRDGADTWCLGARTDQAPTFEDVLNAAEPRKTLPVIPTGGFAGNAGISDLSAVTIDDARAEQLTDFQQGLFGLIVKNMSDGRLEVGDAENQKHVDEMLATLKTQGDLNDYAMDLKTKFCG
jgi:phospholipase C